MQSEIFITVITIIIICIFDLVSSTTIFISDEFKTLLKKNFKNQLRCSYAERELVC